MFIDHFNIESKRENMVDELIAVRWGTVPNANENSVRFQCLNKVEKPFHGFQDGMGLFCPHRLPVDQESAARTRTGVKSDGESRRGRFTSTGQRPLGNRRLDLINIHWNATAPKTVDLIRGSKPPCIRFWKWFINTEQPRRNS
jgi:hypothetical protein